MLKRQHLISLDRIASLIGMFSIGFLCGMGRPEANIFIPCSGVLICAIMKIQLNHLAKKLQNSEGQETISEPK